MLAFNGENRSENGSESKREEIYRVEALKSYLNELALCLELAMKERCRVTLRVILT